MNAEVHDQREDLHAVRQGKVSKPRVRVEGWRIVEAHAGGYRLVGESAIGHPELGGEAEMFGVRTSLIVRLDFATCEVETLNTVYELGEPLEPRVLP